MAEGSSPVVHFLAYRLGLKFTHGAATGMTALSLAGLVLFVFDFTTRINQPAESAGVSAELAGMAMTLLGIGALGAYLLMLAGDLVCAWDRTDPRVRLIARWIVLLGAAPLVLAAVVFVLLGPLASVVRSMRLAAVLIGVALILLRRIVFLWNVIDVGMLAGNDRLSGRVIAVAIGTALVWMGLYFAWPSIMKGEPPRDGFATLSQSLLVLGGAVVYYAGLVWLTSGTIASLADQGHSPPPPG
jgi:hypothetical protein